jgi:hypothetical protein
MTMQAFFVAMQQFFSGFRKFLCSLLIEINFPQRASMGVRPRVVSTGTARWSALAAAVAK